MKYKSLKHPGLIHALQTILINERKTKNIAFINQQNSREKLASDDFHPYSYFKKFCFMQFIIFYIFIATELIF